MSRCATWTVILTASIPALLYGQPPAADEKESKQTAALRSGEPDAAAPPIHHEVIVVTATRTETNVLELPVSVSIVSQAEVEQKQFNNPNVGEVVRDLPGVCVGHGNRNIPPWIHLRGTGYFIGRTLYLVDELPLAEPMVSIAVHPSNLASTEVLLGP